MKFTIKRKMLLGFGVVIVLMIATNLYVLRQMQKVTAKTTQTYAYDVRGLDLAKQMRALLIEEEPYAQKAAALRDPDYYNVFAEQVKVFTQLSDSLIATSLSENDRALVERVRAGHSWFVDAVKRATYGNARPTDAEFDEGARNDTLEALHAALNEFITGTEQSIKRSMAEADSRMTRSANVAYILTAITFLIALTAAVLVTRTISKPLGVLIQGTDQIAQGNFSPIEVQTQDEMSLLARAINEMSAKLQSIEKMRTEMMHHISHELRTPLQAMTSALNLMTDQRYGSLTSEQARLAQFVREGINKITAFSHQFLDISKIESGAMKYNFAPTDLLGILSPVIEEAKLIALRKSISLTVGTSPIPRVKGDAEKLPQVFSNLLTNAIKYTPERGKIHIEIGPSKYGVRVSVTDSGVGIAPEDLPNIFTKFYQAKNADKASSRGTGVGLALVKALVEAHGGRVFAESTVGAGTTFTVELPAVKEQLLPDFAASLQQSVN
jgi:two-component system sensor histidine kinase GlrK